MPMMVISFIFSGVFFSFSQAQNMSPAEEARLRSELAKLEEEIKEQEKVLNIQRSQSASIERDVSVLITEINKAKNVIRQQEIQISKLGSEIRTKSKTISSLSQSIERGKDSLARLIQRTNEFDQLSLAHLLLGRDTISSFYADLNDVSTVNRSLQETLFEVKEYRGQTEVEKGQLEIKQNEELDAKKKSEQEKKAIEKNEAEKKQLLSISKNKEEGYKKILAERQAQAATIRAALFRLRDSGPIPFGDAYEYAKVASSKTGVRPALILAILTQESNLGSNVGTCFLSNPVTGDGVRITSGTPISRVMKPTRDVSPFLSITKQLGRDPYQTRVSCPWTVGYGGAMGPSQFIPSTWIIFADKIASTLSVSLADPWNPQHAITATALYMADLGAGSKTYSSERDAACRYYSGASCTAPHVSNLFYGNAVMALAEKIQGNIDVLESI